MEIFSASLFCIFAIVSIYIGLSHLREMKKFNAEIISLRTSLTDLDRSLADFKKSSEVSQLRASMDKPLKPNNWDSMKEAFKGPARVSINE